MNIQFCRLQFCACIFVKKNWTALFESIGKWTSLSTVNVLTVLWLCWDCINCTETVQLYCDFINCTNCTQVPRYWSKSALQSQRPGWQMQSDMIAKFMMASECRKMSPRNWLSRTLMVSRPNFCQRMQRSDWKSVNFNFLDKLVVCQKKALV